MGTEVFTVQPSAGFEDAVRAATEVLQRGGLVVFPTETVYGVAARADQAAAMSRLRDIKTRGPDKAFTVHIGLPGRANDFAGQVNGVAARLIRKGWPGPLTIILPVEDPASTSVVSKVNGSAVSAMYFDKTIGLRCPDDAVAQSILTAVDAPVVAASANLAGHPPPWTGPNALSELEGRVDLLIDTGRTKYAKPSTIVRAWAEGYEIVREGVYDARIVEQLSKVGILFVCTGNTCRSPMAAALAKKLLAERLGCDAEQLTERFGVIVGSAGTAGGLGGAADHARAVMAKRGIDLSKHVSRALTAELVRQADHIFAMTRAHREQIVATAPFAAERVRLLIENEDVQDPIGGTEQDYEACAQRIEDALRARLQEVPL